MSIYFEYVVDEYVLFSFTNFEESQTNVTVLQQYTL